ncbi:unnamed protein product, partial [Cyprideis torosa]
FRAADPIARSGSTRLPPPLDFSECGKPESRCNGLWECPDGSDEASCSCRERIDALYVVPNKEPSRVCDGDRDCPFGDDETGCGKCPRRATIDNSGVTEFATVPMDAMRNTVICWLQLQIHLSKISTFTLRACFIGGFPRRLPRQIRHQISCPSATNPMSSWRPRGQPLKSAWKPFLCTTLACQPSVTEVALPDRSLAAVKRGQVWVQDVCPTKKGFFVTCDPKESLDSCVLPDTPISQCQCQRRHELWLPSRNKWSFEGRVVGGIATQVLRNPWIASISRKGIPFCGGAITWSLRAIASSNGPHRFLRAKVYTFETAHYEMTAGSDRVHSEPFSLQRRHATMVKVHPHVDEPWVFNLWVQPICLPSPSVGSSFPPADMECRVADWGRQEWQGNV